MGKNSLSTASLLAKYRRASGINDLSPAPLPLSSHYRPSMNNYSSPAPLPTKTKVVSSHPAINTPPYSDDTRRCSGSRCYTKLPPSSRFKNCEKCRASNREKFRQKAERAKKRKLELLETFFDNKDEPSSDDVMQVVDGEDLPIEKRLQLWMEKLRAAGKLPLATRENGRSDYTATAGDVLGKRVALDDAGPSTTKKRKVELDVAWEEYQSQSHLCQALVQYLDKLRSVTSVGDFTASYTVIVDREAEVTEKKVKRVAKEMFGEAMVLTSSESSPVVKFRISNGKPSCRLEYRCACSDDPPSSSLSLQESNLCGGIVSVEIRAASMELPDLKRIFGEKIIVKIMHN